MVEDHRQHAERLADRLAREPCLVQLGDEARDAARVEPVELERAERGEDAPDRDRVGRVGAGGDVEPRGAPRLRGRANRLRGRSAIGRGQRLEGGHAHAPRARRRSSRAELEPRAACGTCRRSGCVTRGRRAGSEPASARRRAGRCRSSPRPASVPRRRRGSNPPTVISPVTPPVTPPDERGRGETSTTDPPNRLTKPKKRKAPPMREASGRRIRDSNPCYRRERAAS